MKRLLLCAFVMLACLPSVSYADTTATVSGTLTERPVEPNIEGQIPAGEKSQYLIATAHGLKQLDASQPESLVGKRVQIDSDLEGKVTPISSTRLASPQSLGPHKVLVLLANFTNDRSTPATTDDLRSAVFTASDSANRFYQLQSNNQVSLTGKLRADGDVFGWYQLPIANTGCDVDAIAAAANTAAQNGGVDISGYDHIVYFFPSTSNCPWTGLADRPGSEIWINGYSQTQVTAHEFGHNMGAAHASEIQCTQNGVPISISNNCTFNEYLDDTDIMGANEGGPHGMSAWHRMEIGQTPTTQAQTVTASGNYNLTSIENTASTSTKLLMIPRQNASGAVTDYFALDIRNTVADNPFTTWDFFPGITTGVSVRIVSPLTSGDQTKLLDATPTSNLSVNDTALTPSHSITDPDYGITITTLSAGAGNATVGITMPAINDASAPSAPSNLTASLVGSNVQLNWSPSTDNIGVVHYEIERNGTTVASTEGTSFADGSWKGLDTATYQIVAVDAAGNISSPSGKVTVVLPDTSAPSVPQGVYAVVGKGGVTVHWKASKDNKGNKYVQYILYKNGNPLASNIASLSYKDAKGKSSSAYQVKAVDKAGNQSAFSNLVHPGDIIMTTPDLQYGAKKSIPKNRKLSFWAPDSKKITVKGGGINASKKSNRITVTVPKKWLKKKFRLTVTATGGYKSQKRYFHAVSGKIR